MEEERGRKKWKGRNLDRTERKRRPGKGKKEEKGKGKETAKGKVREGD